MSQTFPLPDCKLLQVSLAHCTPEMQYGEQRDFPAEFWMQMPTAHSSSDAQSAPAGLMPAGTHVALSAFQMHLVPVAHP